MYSSWDLSPLPTTRESSPQIEIYDEEGNLQNPPAVPSLVCVSDLVKREHLLIPRKGLGQAGGRSPGILQACEEGPRVALIFKGKFDAS